MVLALRSAVAAILLEATLGSRVKRSNNNPHAKFIGGVPVLNYEKVHRGKRSADGEEDWLVMLNDKAGDSDIAAFCERAEGACRSIGHPDKGGIPFFDLRATEETLEALMSADTKHVVKFIEPDPVEMILDVGVEDLSKPSGDVSTFSNSVWSARRVGAGSSDATGSVATGKGVHVYVVDSGCRSTHRDFGGRAIPVLDTTVGNGDNGVDCNGDTSCATDSIGHGTHVAGSVGGTTFGVAPDSLVHPMKISFDGFSTWSRTIVAFDWAAAKGERPAVVTASVGGSGTSAGLEGAVNTLTNRGVLVLTSAGNSGRDACGWTPANVANCMSVGATSGTDTPAFFSNFGSCVDIWAPGIEVISGTHTSDTGSMKRAGTSMAAPHVAGGAAVFLEQNPSLSAVALRTKLENTALDNMIPEMKAPDDSNRLLWVGLGTPPARGELELCRRRRRILCFA